jgi:uncharacterized protein YgiM (DUF1202 family)
LRCAIRVRIILALILISVAAATYYHYRRKPREIQSTEAAYVVPSSVDVADSPAQVHSTLASLKSGERVGVVSRTAHWVCIRLADGRTGWVEAKALLDSATQQKAGQLLEGLESFEPQAVGHTTTATSLRLEPSRESVQLAELTANLPLQVFGREIVARASTGQASKGAASQAKPKRDTWYLVRAQSRAGWVLGRLVSLDIPQAIALYAQESNLVAWLVLNSVNDGGREVPQYLVADRIGTQDFDFSHIRVFTWWVKHHKYVTAYVESDLNGYFPIRIVRGLDKPYFRLRLVDEEGEKYQKVYGLFSTIVRPLGTVKGWESEAMPATQPHAPKRGNPGAKRTRQPAGHHIAD